MKHALVRLSLQGLLVLLFSLSLLAQSLTSGAIVGTVSDPSGAVVPKAGVTAKNDATGAVLSVQSDEEGFYRFSFLVPGNYTVEASAAGFRATAHKALVYLGQTSTVDIRLAVQPEKSQVTVVAEAPLLQTSNANLATSFSGVLVQESPNPGNDLTFVVQTSPGTMMNTQQGLGGFSSYGMPGTSNVFTVNGMTNNQPFLNLNNAGATNLLLGLGEVQELTVINNAYSGEYGGLAGTQINVVTRSGSNDWHGDARYWWNGRVLNANDWFNNHTQPPTPKSFDNANQWNASVGGPLRKDKTFLFVYTEGLRVVIPTSNQVLIPSPQFEAATLANLAGTGLAASVPFYQQMFALYAGAPGASAATPVPFSATQNGGCSNFTGLPLGVPCALEYRSIVNNLSSEWILSARVDHIFGDRDRFFARFRTDHGTQATYTDPISPLFNIVGTQPQYEGQISETHTFSDRVANNFVLSASWFGLVESNRDRAATLALFPTTLQLGDGSLSTLGGIDHLFPQGRNTTQYGFVDDVTFVSGRDTVKIGATYQRYDITDLDYPILSSGFLTAFTLNDFFNGGATGDVLAQNFFTRASQPLASYRLGWYAQDEHRLGQNLTVMLSLRFDHNSTPVCQTNCFSYFPGDFSTLGGGLTTPYSQLIVTGRHKSYVPGDRLMFQPRLGFAWQPLAHQDLVVRGGIGLFSDAFPAAIADRIAANPPLVNSFILGGAPLAPTQPGNVFDNAATANAVFAAGFASGASFLDLLFVPGFIPPNVENPPRRALIPRYQEWSLEVQKGWGPNTVMKVAYVGNHGIHELVQNNGVNGFCNLPCPFGFAGLPSLPPDPRFGTINQLVSGANSNYNGLTVSVQHRLGWGLNFQGNYTWSHAMDEVSNGGLLNFNFGTNNSILNQIDPNNLRRFNYGNADYDVRHYFSLNYVYELPFHGVALGGWQLSGVIFARSGLPFSVTDSTTTGVLNLQNYGGTVLANYLGVPPTSCGSSAAALDSTPCLTPAQFSPVPDFMTVFPTGFGNQRRNQFRGPGYFDTDFAVSKRFAIPRWERGSFTAGVQFFNLFNHPNFDQPVANLADPRFGHIIHTVSPPTTVLGSFLGGDASPRVIRLSARFSF